jgi:hypothetical protein
MNIKSVLFFLGIVFLSTACRKSEKKNLVHIEQQELAKGIRNDSLFLGLYFGMSKEDFLEYCWKLNKQGLITDGNGMTVEHQLGIRDFQYPLKMNFYPQFKNDKIRELPICFSYKTYEFFNQKMTTETILNDVKKLMEQWYGEDFFVTTLPQPMPNNIKGYAQVKGNRRVLIFVEKDVEVMVLITDLTARE